MENIMKCIPVNDKIDLCVSVKAKLIHKEKEPEDITLALLRNDTVLKAKNIGNTYEPELAEKVKQQVLEFLKEQ
jgi:hypothetical protein